MGLVIRVWCSCISLLISKMIQSIVKKTINYLMSKLYPIYFWIFLVKLYLEEKLDIVSEVFFCQVFTSWTFSVIQTYSKSQKSNMSLYLNNVLITLYSNFWSFMLPDIDSFLVSHTHAICKPIFDYNCFFRDTFLPKFIGEWSFSAL